MEEKTKSLEFRNIITEVSWVSDCLSHPPTQLADDANNTGNVLNGFKEEDEARFFCLRRGTLQILAVKGIGQCGW
jgi:hypothetical protein